ncbi:MAG: hypothetical protein COB67_10520 [SAR324 cluster bacterium]|uniref:Uncharacterized protein n=1 Tax=SAR324 cluster bacterium TaxID=2024889 RepID=A0A2A4SXX1_9DELT|nr:MAG: hypothetical protein COB67_10520 [SAR324 cluster bacterium]
MTSNHEEHAKSYQLEKRFFTTMLGKIRSAALKYEVPNFIGAHCEQGFCLSYSPNGYYVLSILDKEKVNVRGFLCRFNPDLGTVSDEAWLQSFEKSEHSYMDYAKGALKSRKLEEFLFVFMHSPFSGYQWQWAGQLDKRMGGIKGVAGSKPKYGSLKTKAMKVPAAWHPELKALLQFVADHDIDLGDLLEFLQAVPEDYRQNLKALLEFAPTSQRPSP